MYSKPLLGTINRYGGKQKSAIDSFELRQLMDAIPYTPHAVGKSDGKVGGVPKS